MNDDGPFNIVLDRIFDTTRVIIIPSKTTAVSERVETSEPNAPLVIPPIKMALSAISVGKRPLHGTNVFVIVAIRFPRRIYNPAYYPGGVATKPHAHRQCLLAGHMLFEEVIQVKRHSRKVSQILQKGE